MLVNADGYFLKLLRMLQLPSGIVVHQEYKKYRIPYVVAFLCFTGAGLCGIIAALFIPDASRIQIMETVYALNAGLNTVEIFVVLQLVRKKVLYLYDDIRSHYSLDNPFAKISDKQVIDMMDKKWIIICTYTCFSLSPLIITSATDVGIDDMRALNFPLVCPWKIDTMWKYLLTLGIEVMATTITNMLLFAGVGIMFCYIVAIRSHSEILRSDLDECFLLDTDDPSIIKKKFILLIRRYQDLIE